MEKVTVEPVEGRFEVKPVRGGHRIYDHQKKIFVGRTYRPNEKHLARKAAKGRALSAGVEQILQKKGARSK